MSIFSGLGKTFTDILGDAGNAVGGAVNAVDRDVVQPVERATGPAVQAIAQAPQVLSRPWAAAPPPSVTPPTPPTPSLLNSVANEYTNPLGTVRKGAQVGANTLNAGANLLSSSTQGIPVVKSVTKDFIKPQVNQIAQSLPRVTQLVTGQIPKAYTTGSLPSRIGAVAQDATNAALLIPGLGEAVKGAEAGFEGAEVAPSLVDSIKASAKINAAYGGASSGATALQQKGATPLSVGLATGEGVVGGATLGGSVPLVGAGAAKLAGATSDLGEEGRVGLPSNDTPEQTAAQLKSLGLSEVPKPTAETAEPTIESNKEAAAKTTDRNIATQGAIDNEMNRQDFAKSPANQTINNPSFDIQEGNDKGAIAQATGKIAEWQSLYDEAGRLGNKLSSSDKAKLSDAINGEDVGQVKNPGLFNTVVDKYRNANDYDLALRRLAGGNTLRYNNGNFSHTYYHTDPEALDRLGIPKDQQYELGKKAGFGDTGASIQGDFRSSHDLPRQYQSEKQAIESTKGVLQPTYKNAIESEKAYAYIARTGLQENLLREALKQSSPNDIADLGMGRDENGKPFTQAAGHLPFNASDRIQGVLNNFKSAWEPKSAVGKVILKGAEKTNALSKKALWFGSVFHYGNETASFLGSNLFHPLIAAKGIGRAFEAVATKGGWQNILEHARTTDINGHNLLESARDMGIELPENSRLNRVSSAFSLTQAEGALKAGVDPAAEEGTKAGALINRIAGQKNDAVEGADPTIAKITRAGAAAPKWTPSQLKLVADAFTKPGLGRFTEGGGARNVVLGKRALEAGLGIAGSAAIAGALPTAKQALNEAGLTFNNPVPNIELKSKNSEGESQEMVLPTDPGGLAAGLATNPSHFLQSRESPSLSFATKLLTNQNWNGAQLADPTKPNYVQNLVKNAALNSVEPIGVQNFTNFQHNPNNPSVAQGVAQEFGGRLKTNPNDPKALSATEYYSALDKYVTGNQTLDTTDKAAALAFVTKDKTPSGQTIELNSPQTEANWGNLAANPNALASVQKFQQASGSHNPEWDLSASQMKTWAEYKSLAPGDPEKDVLSQKNAFIAKTEQDSQNWENKQTFSGNIVQGAGYIPYPNLTSEQNDLLNQSSKLGAVPPAQRTTEQQAQLTAVENNPALSSAYEALDKYTNAQRAQQGLSPINYMPNASPAVSNWSNAYEAASTADRKAMKAADPNMYAQMNQSYEQSDLGSLEKQAAIAYLSGKPSDELLSAIYNLGTYDVNKGTNPNGTSNYSLTGFTGSPFLGNSGSGLPVTQAVGGYAPNSSSEAAYKASSGSGSALDKYFAKVGMEDIGKAVKEGHTLKIKHPKKVYRVFSKAPSGGAKVSLNPSHKMKLNNARALPKVTLTKSS